MAMARGHVQGALSQDPHQRKNQVKQIAGGVFDNVERNTPDDPDDLEDSNYQPEAAHMNANILHHSTVEHKGGAHTHHVTYKDGGSAMHHVMPGAECPHCENDPDEQRPGATGHSEQGEAPRGEGSSAAR